MLFYYLLHVAFSYEVKSGEDETFQLNFKSSMTHLYSILW